jgi:hypothetical protein
VLVSVCAECRSSENFSVARTRLRQIDVTAGTVHGFLRQVHAAEPCWCTLDSGKLLHVAMRPLLIVLLLSITLPVSNVSESIHLYSSVTN